MDLETLTQWATEEIEALIAALPSDVVAAVGEIVLSLEGAPTQDDLESGLIGDELGLFEGACADEERDPSDLPRIRLFLNHLWDWTEGDEQDFRDEVGITYLHELGHYLGWNEDDLADRGLE